MRAHGAASADGSLTMVTRKPSSLLKYDHASVAPMLGT